MNIQIQALNEANNALQNTVDNLFQMGGLKQPISMLTDTLRNFFEAKDDNDSDKPVPLYKTYSEDAIIERVYLTCEYINFFVTLHDAIRKVQSLQSADNRQP